MQQIAAPKQACGMLQRRQGGLKRQCGWTASAAGGLAPRAVATRATPAPRAAATPATGDQASPLLRASAGAAASAALSLLLAVGGPAGPAGAAGAEPVFDAARAIASEVRPQLSRQLDELESSSGWKVRVYSAYEGTLAAREAPSPRELWGPPDNRTLWLRVDPSSPNILNMVYIGDEVLFKLRRPFLQEVQSRFGNMFFVRDNGESAAVEQAVGVLAQCLAAPEGCKTVPGLPSEQYGFTLAFSVAGGLIAGFVSRIKPQGIVKRQWVWLLVFSPLWAPLFINFGLGPVVSRTSDLAPVLGNFAGFAAAASLPWLLPALDRAVAAPPAGDGEGGGGGP